MQFYSHGCKIYIYIYRTIQSHTDLTSVAACRNTECQIYMANGVLNSYTDSLQMCN